MRAADPVSETLRYSDKHSIRGISLRRKTIRRGNGEAEMRREESKLVLRNR